MKSRNHINNPLPHKNATTKRLLPNESGPFRKTGARTRGIFSGPPKKILLSPEALRRHTSHFSAASPGGERKGAQNSSPPPPGRNVVYRRKNKSVDNIRTSGVEEASSLRRHVKNVRPAGAENVGSPKLPSAGPPKAPYSELQRLTSIPRREFRREFRS